MKKVKKPGLNTGRKFFCCPNDKESSCKYFEWVPEEPYQDVGFVKLVSSIVNDFPISWNIWTFYLNSFYWNTFINIIFKKVLLKIVKV